MRVLLIEDNPGDARLIQELLKETGNSFQLHTVEKLQSGIQFLLSQKVDAVILDMNLPDSRGIETLTGLQSQFPHLPIVLMTSIDDTELAAQAVRSGAQDYLVKGQTDGELLRRSLVYAIERKQAEVTILKAKEEWELTFNSVPDLIVILDCQHRVVRANKAMSDRLGVTPEKCVGLHCYQAIHGLSCPPDFCPHFHTCQDGKEHVADVHEPLLGGDFLVSTTPTRDRQGKITGSIHVARDITDRKQAETELQTSRKFLEIANRHSDLKSLLQAFVQETQEVTHCEAVGIRILDEKGIIPYYAYTGFSSQFYDKESPLSIYSDKCMCINVIKGNTNPEKSFYTPNGSFFMNGTTKFLATVSEEEKGQTRNVCNSTGYESVALIPIRVGKRIMGLIHIADRRENRVPLNTVRLLEQVASALGISIHRALAEESLKQRTLELESTNKELESFSYTVSHDLRAPLRAMDGFSNILLEDYTQNLDPQAREYLQRIRSSSRLMSQLIEDLLTLSRITRAPINMHTINLSELAEEVVTELKRAQSEHQAEFRITPGIEAQGDRNLLKLVLENLLGNAFKFTGKCAQPRIEFGVNIENGGPVYFVRDNGAGFDMAYVDKLFKPFQRLHSTSEFPGTGIGLASVQRIINRHGGRVWAEGKKDNGATFCFTLG